MKNKLKRKSVTKIGLVVSVMNCGGLETYVLTFAQFLKKTGKFDVKVVVTDRKGPWFDRIQEEFKLSHLYIPGYRFLINFIPFGIIFHSLIVGFRLRLLKFDYLLINHSRQAQYSAFLLSSYTKVYSVLHNNNVEIFKVGCHNYRFLNGIICVSDKVKDEAIKYAPESKFYTIYNGISSTNLIKDKKSITEKIVIVFAGRIVEEQKGIFLIPEILENLLVKKVPFIVNIIGDGPDLDDLKTMIQNCGLNNNVKFFGQLSNDEVKHIFSSSHIFLMPSYYEGLPITLLESMAQGCVPIVSDLKGITDICIKDKVSGFLVNSRDPCIYVQHILELFYDEALFVKMSNQAMIKISKNFTVEQMVSKYLHILEDLSTEDQISFKNSVTKTKIYSWREYIPNFVKKFK